MERQELIEQLSMIQSNIDSVDMKISNIRTSSYYGMFEKESKRKHDISIQEKCLAYWKRRFNRVSFKLMYNL